MRRSGRELSSSRDGRRVILDAAIDVQSPPPAATSATILVEARRELTPRDVEQLFAGLAGSLRLFASHVPVLVVAPWLSPRTCEKLVAAEVNYLDLTGNALIRLDQPAVFLQSTGPARNPEPTSSRGPARARGPRAGRLIRLLADVRPPYGLRALAAATGLTPGYVSRLLDALDREAVIEREPRGPVRSVDVSGLIRHWTQGYDMFTSNNTATFFAPRGPASMLDEIASVSAYQRICVTGSFAAVRHAPVAAPAQLVVYCEEDPDQVAEQLGLLPADEVGDVVLLHPFDPVVWQHGEREGAIRYAAPSQVAADCLTGNGRMPAEGEALLDWMVEHEDEWRMDALPEIT